ncbi:hypothetical protein GUITHDRAFT_120748 [Guillardia theta CCMP2712]|uniref:TOG domain-containing protein n=1 Tax=Guillardia theta (strain CCMP2712) TaxID=905079 RepID=L1IA34_GUITC|nr:hypothetical protein GUITHDRAFT_120748 [Guillardia theta CCMP2712]EKX33088.1 hypothetical protein GUITHDRAFT_120748 [Guillardia theta CCMP2712]|eukprot:XP_005820068.1 hypothetical protein GUITHDRAFT_120748 [Guillardia theta CCMP2712]
MSARSLGGSQSATKWLKLERELTSLENPDSRNEGLDNVRVQVMTAGTLPDGATRIRLFKSTAKCIEDSNPKTAIKCVQFLHELVQHFGTPVALNADQFLPSCIAAMATSSSAVRQTIVNLLCSLGKVREYDARDLLKSIADGVREGGNELQRAECCAALVTVYSCSKYRNNAHESSVLQEVVVPALVSALGDSSNRVAEAAATAVDAVRARAPDSLQACVDGLAPATQQMLHGTIFRPSQLPLPEVTSTELHSRGETSERTGGPVAPNSHGSDHSADLAGKQLAFVPPRLLAELQDAGNWRVRALAVEELQQIVRGFQRPEELRPYLPDLIDLLITLTRDANFKIEITALQILGDVINLVERDVHPFQHQLMPNFIGKLADNKTMVRQANIKVLLKLMQTLGPKEILEGLMREVKHESWRVREEILHVVVLSLLTFQGSAGQAGGGGVGGKPKFDFAFLVRSVCSVLEDSKQKVRAIALEALALLHSLQGADKFRASLPPMQEQTLRAVEARLALAQLPSLNLEGWLELSHLGRYVEEGSHAGQEERAERNTDISPDSLGEAPRSPLRRHRPNQSQMPHSYPTSPDNPVKPLPRSSFQHDSVIGFPPLDDQPLYREVGPLEDEVQTDASFLLPSGGVRSPRRVLQASGMGEAGRRLHHESAHVEVAESETGGSSLPDAPPSSSSSSSDAFRRPAQPSSSVSSSGQGRRDKESSRPIKPFWMEGMRDSAQSTASTAMKEEASQDSFIRGGRMRPPSAGRRAMHAGVGAGAGPGAGPGAGGAGAGADAWGHIHETSSMATLGGGWGNLENTKFESIPVLPHSTPMICSPPMSPHSVRGCHSPNTNQRILQAGAMASGEEGSRRKEESTPRDLSLSTDQIANRLSILKTRRGRSGGSRRAGSAPFPYGEGSSGLGATTPGLASVSSSMSSEISQMGTPLEEEQGGSGSSYRPSQSAPASTLSPAIDLIGSKRSGGNGVVLPSVEGGGGGGKSVMEINARPLELIPTEELAPLDNPDGVMRTLLAKLGSSDWAVQMEALNLTRALSIYHASSTILPQLHVVVRAILLVADSLRSNLSKSALMALTDMLRFLKTQMDAELDNVVLVLVKKSGETAGFIADEARKAMLAMIENCSEGRTLGALLHANSSKNPLIRAKVASYLCALVESMGPKLLNSKDLERLFPVVVQFLSEGSAEPRQAGKRAMLEIHMLSKATGEFDRLLRRCADADVRVVEKVLAQEKAMNSTFAVTPSSLLKTMRSTR